MPDRSLIITSFKYGLDSRRQDLAAQPGTLVQCTNAHINPGGEVEKRNAFVPDLHTFPANTFGIQDVASGLMCFGSDAAPNGTLPAQVVYQRLQSPTGAAMTGVVASTNFQGNAFVIAKYADGTQYFFYNGVIVNESYIGKVLPGLNLFANLATQFSTQVNTIPGWIATPNVDAQGNALPGSVIVKSPGGITFAPVDTVHTTTISAMGSVNLNDTQPTGTTEVHAAAAFQVTGAVAGTFQLFAPAKSDGTGTAILASVNCLPTTTATAVAIANSVNSNTVVTGYTAIADPTNGDVFVFAPDGWGAAANGFVLTITVTGLAAFGNAIAAFNLTATASPNPAFDLAHTSGDALFSINVSVTPKGGIAPYTYVWSEVTGSASGMTITQSINGSVATFSRIMPGPTTLIKGIFQCAVSDSSSQKFTVTPITVVMESF